MRRPNRSPRIGAVCILGKRALTTRINAQRRRLLAAVASALTQAEDWQDLDALLFPGGFFRLSRFIGHLDYRDRKAVLERMPVVRTAIEAAKRLHRRSPGCLVVFGADSSAPAAWEYGDQFCIAVDRTGVVGLARKIFPTDKDTAHCRRVYVPYAADYGSQERYVRLASGHLAALSACFDMFAFCGDAALLAQRSVAIRDLRFPGSCPRIEEPGFYRLRRELVASWDRVRYQHRPTVALAAIHGFARPGRDSYWQRHGIAVASAGVLGGLAVGAGHFVQGLPGPSSSTLAAYQVSRRIIHQGPHRPAHRLLPKAALELGQGAALARLFAP